jgi:hypothetical protein
VTRSAQGLWFVDHTVMNTPKHTTNAVRDDDYAGCSNLTARRANYSVPNEVQSKSLVPSFLS